MIPTHLKQFSGLSEIVKDVVGRAQKIAEAVDAVSASIDPAAATAAVKSGAAGKASPINEAALTKAIAKLRAAVAIGPLIDKLETMFGDSSNRAALKKMAGDRGWSGGIEEARGGLQSITPQTVAVSAHIRDIIANIQAHEALAGSPAAQKSLARAEADLKGIQESLSNDIVRLVAVIDKGIGATFS